MSTDHSGLTGQDDTCTLQWISQSAEETQHLGMMLGTCVRAGDLILLRGDLGAGKTTFTQGLARGMDITENVNSPTFPILKEYSRPLVSDQVRVGVSFQGSARALYHFDLYRLVDPDEILDLGFEEYLYGSGVSVVEWAENAESFWPGERLSVSLTLVDETQRRLLFQAMGERYCELLRQLQKSLYANSSS